MNLTEATLCDSFTESTIHSLRESFCAFACETWSLVRSDFAHSHAITVNNVLLSYRIPLLGHYRLNLIGSLRDSNHHGFVRRKRVSRNRNLFRRDRHPLAHNHQNKAFTDDRQTAGGVRSPWW